MLQFKAQQQSVANPVLGFDASFVVLSVEL